MSAARRCSTVAAIVSAALLVPAPSAAADPTDDAFLGALARGGIAMSDPDSAVATAHSVCAGLDANQNTSLLAMKLKKSEGLSLKQSGYFIGVSVAAYCPANKDKAGVSVDWLLPFPPMM